MNFRQLDELIHRGAEEIVLDSDVVLDDGEAMEYLQGIEINSDIVIDGCGYAIDAKDKSSIFSINANEVILKNIVFINAHGRENGGAIRHDRGILDVVGCKFMNNFCDVVGSAIFCSRNGNVRAFSSYFSQNNAGTFGCIYNLNGIVEINDCDFVKNEESCIINQRRGRLSVKDSRFISNSAENGAGIGNFGKCDVKSCLFEDNGASREGGAINNQNSSHLTIEDSKFIGNVSAIDGGAVINLSKAKIDNCIFSKNRSNNSAGALSNQKNSIIEVSGSAFMNNHSMMSGGAIFNWGEISADDLKFESNSSKVFGGAVFNHEGGIFNIKHSNFIGNESNSGGAILNWAKLALAYCLFESNTSEVNGGAINCSKKSSLVIGESKFIGNLSKNGSAIFNNSADTKFLECKFKSHGGIDVVHNFKSLQLFGCNFKNNSSKRIIFNDAEAILNIYGGEFVGNAVKSHVVHNVGQQCILDKILFEANRSDMEYCDICNEGNMLMSNLKLKSAEKSVLNKASMDVRQMDVVKIKNCGVINDYSKNDNEFDFTLLDKLIRSNSSLRLNHDFCLERYEYDFFEGGIEIDRDNIVIDGSGHIIDGRNRSRIFIINAKNVVFKNIIFKNGFYLGNFDKYLSGGGAVHVVKTASVKFIKCSFIENKSNSNGGAILNDGHVKSINSKYVKNESKSFGAAIHNKQTLITSNDGFANNSSRIDGAIYNGGRLLIENIDLNGNESEFQPIYNAGLIDAFDFEGLNDLIFNSSKLQLLKENAESFKYLVGEMEKSNEVKLDKDIVFNYKTDYMLKQLLTIKKDLVIDGCGHSIEYNSIDDGGHVIDGGNSSSLFRIREDGIKVVLRNIVFKNCYSNNQDIIENHGNLIIERCKFINSKLTADNAFINNMNTLTIVDSHFSNNVASRQSLIANSSRMNISNSIFINNVSQAMGSCILNDGKSSISNSIFKSNNTNDKASCIFNEHDSYMKIMNVEFKHNDADIDGGVIYNYGKIDIDCSEFSDNLACDEGGVINNRTSGDLKIKNSKFSQNESKTNGGVIFNYGKADIFKCSFIANSAKVKSSAIQHAWPLDTRLKTYLKVSDCEFMDNRSSDGNVIHSYDGGDVNMVNCSFR